MKGAVKHCSSTVYYCFTLFQEGFLVFCGCICTPSVNVASPVCGSITSACKEKQTKEYACTCMQKYPAGGDGASKPCHAHAEEAGKPHHAHVEEAGKSRLMCMHNRWRDFLVSVQHPKGGASFLSNAYIKGLGHMPTRKARTR
jgi:hypothetical protein